MRATTTATITILILALLVTPFLTGCDGDGGGGSTRLLGRVVDDGSLQTVAAARVVAGSAQAITDLNGRFDLGNVPSSGNVAVTANDYLSQQLAIPAGGNEIDMGDIYLVPARLPDTGDIQGIVTSAGVGAAGATIRAGGREAVSRANGAYTLYNVPIGFQTVYATSADNMTGGSRNVTVYDGTAVIANIALSVVPPPPPLD